MDLSPFKLDIDELITDFSEGDFKSFADMKRVWLARKFSYIFDAKPSSANLALFMQSLYAHCAGHMVETYSLSHRLGGLYCLYCFYEVQPFKPPFKIYLSIDELRRLKALVIEAKKKEIRVASALVRRMLERNAFVFGFVDMNDYSESETLKIEKHKAMLRKMHEKLFPDRSIDQFLNMDMGMDLDLAALTKISTEYAEAKALVLKEASELVDVQDIKHIAEDAPSIADHVGKIAESWNQEKDAFNRKTRAKGRSLPQETALPVQEPADESPLVDESLPPDGFMKLLTGGDEVEDPSQDIDVDEIERLLETGDGDSQEEETGDGDAQMDEDSGFADYLDEVLSENEPSG